MLLLPGVIYWIVSILFIESTEGSFVRKIYETTIFITTFFSYIFNSPLSALFHFCVAKPRTGEIIIESKKMQMSPEGAA
jgi:hypothetical protein